MRTESIDATRRHCALAFCVISNLLLVLPARADKIYFNTGKVIEGLVKEEFPSKVEFLFQGQIITVKRTRIDRIEIESGGENIETLIADVETAIRRMELDQARLMLDQALELNGPGGTYIAQLRQIERRLSGLRAKGDEAARRIYAENLLEQAQARFDKVQNRQGIKLLREALEQDQTYEAAHVEMAKYMRENRPDLRLVIDYFSDLEDLNVITDDHPIIDWLPEVFVEIKQSLDAEREAEKIRSLTRQLVKVSKGFADHPAWTTKATSAQATLVRLTAGGVITVQTESDLRAHDFDQALNRLEAWKRASAGSEVSQLYVRARIGKGQIDQADRILDAARANFGDLTWITRATNVLSLYSKALASRDRGNDAEARALFERMFGFRADMMPEIYELVARAKVDYDIADMRALEAAGDTTAAAALAVQIYEYVTSRADEDLAVRTFEGLAPEIAYNLIFIWEIDGAPVSFEEHPESAQIVREVFESRFNLKFSDLSPFVMYVRLATSTFTGSGARIAATASKSQAFEIDFVEPDDSVTGVRVETFVSHPNAQSLFSWIQPVGAVPDGTKLGRTQDGGLNVFFDIQKLGVIDDFLSSDFSLYLPVGLATIGSQLQLPAKR